MLLLVAVLAAALSKSHAGTGSSPAEHKCHVVRLPLSPHQPYYQAI
jgi:hypothetical protein